MNILVTGISGFLGTNMVLQSPVFGEFELFGVGDKPFNSQINFHNFQLLDLRNYEQVKDLLKEISPDVIVNLAALTNVDLCEQDPDLAEEINVGILKNLVRASAPRVRFVQISTDSVFDGKAGNYKEDSKPYPVNRYAETKLMAEKFILKQNPNNLVIRINIYGWDFSERVTLMEWVIKNLLENREINMFTDVKFNPVPAPEIAEIIFRMIEKQASGLFHLGCDDPVSKFEFGQAVARVFKLPSHLIKESVSDSIDFKAPRPKIPTLNNSKIKSFLGTDIPDINQGLNYLKHLLPKYLDYFTGKKSLYQKLAEVNYEKD